ncbi:MAG: hypothetical protein SF172_15975 [Burkholderiales bacterium]|nr:hypothetical protein [Burkholderiales bacterium]
MSLPRAMFSARHSLKKFLARGLGLLAGAAVFAVWWVFKGDPGPVTARHQVQGEIVEVRECAYRVRLDAGGEVLVARSFNLEQGRKVTLNVETYAKGEAVHMLADPTGQ